MAKSLIWRAVTHKPIATKLYMSGDVYDIIMFANFGEDRLRSFGAVRGRILALRFTCFDTFTTFTSVLVCNPDYISVQNNYKLAHLTLTMLLHYLVKNN